MSEGLFMRISPADWQDSFLLLLLSTAAWAAARRAMGTRNGEQLA